MQFNIHEAKTQFSKLVAAVERGEKVTICRDGKPVMECVPVQPKREFPFGALAHLAPKNPGDMEHMVGPTDDELLDQMGL